jgi:hypothetical protein
MHCGTLNQVTAVLTVLRALLRLQFRRVLNLRTRICAGYDLTKTVKSGPDRLEIAGEFGRFQTE